MNSSMARSAGVYASGALVSLFSGRFELLGECEVGCLNG